MQKIGSITPTADANGEWTNGNVAAGTPPTILEAGWLNTVQRELENIVISSGLVLDPANDGQVLAALLESFPGRLLAVRIYPSSGSYTSSPGTKRRVVTVVGAGGGGGGTAVTTSESVAAGSGGGGGGHAKSILDGASVAETITVGLGGNGGLSGSAPSAGGASSCFGLTASGGQPGANCGPVTDFRTLIPNGGGGQGSGGNIINGAGGSGSPSIILTNNFLSGMGGQSFLSCGGNSINFLTSSVGLPGRLGSGGSGAFALNSAPSALIGGAGGDGIVIIEEYA